MTVQAAPLQLLADAKFRQVWVAGIMVGVARWLDTLAVGVYVLIETGSPLLVAMTLFVRTLPMLLFGVVAGAVAERFDRRRLLIASLTVLALYSMMLAALSLAGRLELWQLAIGVFLSGLFWTIEMPARRTLMVDVAGMERIGAAMGLESATNNFTRMLGPFAGGLLFELFGMPGTLILGVALYGIALAEMLALKTEPRAAAAGDVAGIFANIAGGLSHVRTNRELMAILAVTICFNLLGFPYVSLVPVIAGEDLGLSPFPTGALMSAEGLGALAGSLWVAFYARTSRFHQIYFVGTVVYFAAVVTFALSQAFWLSLPALLIAGGGMAGFATMQSALVMASTPPELRNRAMGVLTMCIGVAPVGIFAVGLLAERLGAAPAVLVSSSIGLAALIGCGVLRPEMTRARGA